MCRNFIDPSDVPTNLLSIVSDNSSLGTCMILSIFTLTAFSQTLSERKLSGILSNLKLCQLCDLPLDIRLRTTSAVRYLWGRWSSNSIFPSATAAAAISAVISSSGKFCIAVKILSSIILLDLVGG